MTLNWKPKPLREQAIVITGATSGIGLATARAAAARGARLMLFARNEEALKDVCADLRARGGQAFYCAGDVGVEADVQRLADSAVERFGGFDTWVNNAGVSMFAALTDTSVADQRRLFDTNYWGVVHGSLTAAAHFKAQRGGGVIVNLGSLVGDVAVPVQGGYSASKHAIHGFTNALRMDLMGQKAPVSVTLVKPAAVDTPYKDNARNLTGHAVKNPPPVYGAGAVAEAVLYAAEHKVRQLNVGGVSLLVRMAYAFPQLTERVVARVMPALLRDRAGRKPPAGDNLYTPGKDRRERSYYPKVRERSLYATAQMHPLATTAFLGAVAAGAVLAYVLGRRRPDARRRV